MENKVTKFVESIDLETCIQIIKDYEEFERLGHTGESTLRIQTRLMLTFLGLDNVETHIVIHMRELVFEVYRYFAYRYLSLL